VSEAVALLDTICRPGILSRCCRGGQASGDVHTASKMSDPKETTAAAGHDEGLRRDVTVWGSYMWGFADVGADTYVALGLVMAYAAGATGLAFGIAGIVYIMIGLAYTELASAYPVAGGGQYFTLRGLGDFWDSSPGRRCCSTTPLTLRCSPIRVRGTSTSSSPISSAG